MTGGAVTPAAAGVVGGQQPASLDGRAGDAPGDRPPIRTLEAPSADRRLHAWLAWAAVSFFWGTTYLAIRVGVASVPPALFSAARFLSAGAVLLFIRRWMGDPFPQRRDWARLAVVGILLLVVGNGLVVLGERWVESGATALAVSAMPIWMALLSSLIPGGERLSWRGAAGLALGAAGLVLLLHPTADARSGHQLLGALFLEVACLSWASGSLLSKRRPADVSPLMGAACQMLTAGLLLLVISLVAGESHHFILTRAGVLSVVYLSIFGSLVAYSCYMFALAHLPATTVSLYAYVNPVVALILGSLLLRESLDIAKLGAAAIILLGVALAQTGVRVTGVTAGADSRRRP